MNGPEGPSELSLSSSIAIHCKAYLVNTTPRFPSFQCIIPNLYDKDKS
jgi:hypothetical protein